MLFKPEQMQHWVDIVEPQAVPTSLAWLLVYLFVTLLLLMLLFILARRSVLVWLLYARYKLRKLKTDIEIQQFVVWLERKLRKQALRRELLQQLQQWRYSGSVINKSKLGSFLQRCQKERRR